VRLLGRKGVVVLPMGGEAEETVETSVEVAFAVEPGDVVPFRMAVAEL
jgi:hypothetical protein